jgi:hypothetical protein
MLDEFIRRTGVGLDAVASETSDGQEDLQALINRKKIYLGLTVHGKKRTDLAKRSDPNAVESFTEDFVPMLWKAIQNDSPKVVTYLRGDGPLAAYRFYAATHSDERAIHLQKTPDLAAVLPGWLGWTVSTLGESPLTAAVLGNKLEMMKKLHDLSPELAKAALAQRLVPIGHVSSLD